MLLPKLLDRQRYNKKPAIVFGSKNITFQDWYIRSNSLARVVQKYASIQTKNISVFLPNSIEYAISYFAVLFSNRVVVPIDIKLKPLEIRSILSYCEVDLIITSLQYREVLTNTLKEYKYKVVIVYIENETCEIFNAVHIKKTSANIKCNTENDVAVMLHTSGTTSAPKRVMLTHKNIITNIESHIQSLNLTSSDIGLISLPMYFGYCNTAQFLTHLYMGATTVVLESPFFAKKFFEIVEQKKITNFVAVPTMLLILLQYDSSYKYDYSTLRYICFGGGKMPIDKLSVLIKKYESVGFVQTYGQTECSPRVTALLPHDSIRKIGSVGQAIPNVSIKIVDDKGTMLNKNQVGEIVVKGDNVMKGYFKQPEITNKAITDEWLHTGDLGYLDEEGYLYLTGRIKNIIISGGVNIYPEEVEQTILEYDGVVDVCVVGEEHFMLGEVPVAKVVTTSTINEMDLKQFCFSRLADYKVPVRIDFVDQIPKTYNGKNKRYQEEN